MYEQGKNSREIYNEYFKDLFDKPMAYSAFKGKLRAWRKLKFPDDTTLVCGTYEGFTAHDATVQVSRTGDIVQAWIKQKANEVDPAEFLKALKQTVEHYEYEPNHFDDASRMLEIPLFDMHWGIAYMDYYKPVLDDILELIHRIHWDRIVIPFGQDFFHNDSIINGQTTKGTNIEKVDMERAVKEGQKFIYAIIDAAIKSANDVRVLYSAGNHDRSISWMFMQVLLERYGPTIVDDSLESRKVIVYGKNSIMVTHGESKQATAKNLAHIFPISFPEEFANADTREVHSGHLHTEAEEDIYGVMVRRLSSGCKVDGWSDKEDFVGAHRRFMIFEWDENKLKSIHYI
jgi:hypothetical protein